VHFERTGNWLRLRPTSYGVVGIASDLNCSTSVAYIHDLKQLRQIVLHCTDFYPKLRRCLPVGQASGDAKQTLTKQKHAAPWAQRRSLVVSASIGNRLANVLNGGAGDDSARAF
jgi:hypothetical protein